MNYLKYILISFLFIANVQIITGQFIWPGDVNDNGIVNGVDVLYAGIAFGATGPNRPGEDDTWAAQPIGDLWAQNFSNGINYAYADCDGKGDVDQNDIQNTIRDNFNLTHGVVVPDNYSSGSVGSTAQVKLTPQSSDVETGSSVVFDISVGDADFPINDFYGIVISMKYNPDFILGGEWEFEDAETAWYNPSNQDAMDLLVSDDSNGKIELAITRTNQTPITGEGQLGQLSIVIEDIVFGLSKDTLNLEIDKILMIDNDFNTLQVAADSTFVVINKKGKLTSSNFDTPEDEINVSIAPNPITEFFEVTSNQVIVGCEVFDIN